MSFNFLMLLIFCVCVCDLKTMIILFNPLLFSFFFMLVFEFTKASILFLDAISVPMKRLQCFSFCFLFFLLLRVRFSLKKILLSKIHSHIYHFFLSTFFRLSFSSSSLYITRLLSLDTFFSSSLFQYFLFSLYL